MRLDDLGAVDRAKPLDFTFDGRAYRGLAGDTLASALLANDVRLVARSFKYHRPRGIMTAGSEEPNALVTVGAGAEAQPNTRATVQELYVGLSARAQNAWPSVRRDAMAVNDLLSPFFGAGFYYKTFMWPRSFWEKLYEPAIRRAAGLGTLPGAPDALVREKAFASCDLLVIGSGPAGLMAALTGARGGADVILAEDDAVAGGRMLAEGESVGGRACRDWAAATLAELRDLGVRVMTRTAITGVYDGGTFGALERVGHHLAAPDPDLPYETFWRIHARAAVLAAGALERPVAFADNDRPGVMLAGAVRAYAHRWGVAPGRAITVFANNDDAHRTARDLAAAGVGIAAVIDARDDATPLGDYELLAGATVTGTRGRAGLREITVSHKGAERRIATDCLAVSGGWNPSVNLTCHRGARPTWNDRIAGFVPKEGAVPGLHVAGAARGTFSTAGCLAEGAAAARAALSGIGMSAPDLPVPAADQSDYAIRPLWHVKGRGRAWLDQQNDVTVKDIALSVQENMVSVEHMKRYTTQGMAPDQGKNSNVAALAVLAELTGRSIPETGTTTFRPPFVPVPLAALGAGAQGKGFAPIRLTTSDAASRARGAPMLEAGLWYRPSYFPAPGETTWREACDREVGYVREAVGVTDVSTLGKIDVQGPDAAAFLEMVYTGRMGTLRPGRVRYGLMLREDGHVLDDGTCARLTDERFLVTTTTAAAGHVMRHMEFVHQCLMPGARVALASVTDHWAQFAVAGPKARELLAGLIAEDVGDAALPFMGWRDVAVHGVAGRLFRISFSGERGYELAVPARHGDALFRSLVARAEGMGGGAYGMEALNVLRIEKGFPTHAEMDGRVTAGDLGLGRMVADKDCIGRAAARRPGLADDARGQLVGLRAVALDRGLLSGAYLFGAEAAPVRAEAQGHVTSACWSPTLGRALALGLLSNGRARHGERVKMVDHVRGVTTLAEVCDPVFLDPEGARARG